MANLKVLVTFHWFLLHFVNDSNSHVWTGLTGNWTNFKKPYKTCGILTSSSFRRVRIEGFWYFSLEIIAFGERAKIWIPGGIWSGQNVRRTDFKKHWKTLGICNISSFWRVRFEGFCYFSIGFNAFCERWKVSIPEGIWSDQKGLYSSVQKTL